MKKFTSKMSNAVEPAVSASVWGRGVPGKGGMSTNYIMVENKTEETVNVTSKSKEKENV